MTQPKVGGSHDPPSRARSPSPDWPVKVSNSDKIFDWRRATQTRPQRVLGLRLSDSVHRWYKVAFGNASRARKFGLETVRLKRADKPTHRTLPSPQRKIHPKGGPLPESKVLCVGAQAIPDHDRTVRGDSHQVFQLDQDDDRQPHTVCMNHTATPFPNGQIVVGGVSQVLTSRAPSCTNPPRVNEV